MFFETIKIPLILNGDVVGILGIARDITKRKEAERILAASYEYSKKLTDALARITKSPNISAGNLKAAAAVIAKIGCDALNTHRVGIWSTTDEAKTLKSITYYDISTGEYAVQDDTDISICSEYISLLKSERLVIINNALMPNPLSSV